MEADRRGRVPTAQGVHLTDIEKCTQAVDRLRQEGPLTGLARARQIDAFQALHSQMEVQEDEFTAMLEAPRSYREAWKERLGQTRKRLEREGLRVWKNGLVATGQPTKALYRWIKGEPVRAPLGVLHKGSLEVGPAPFFSRVRQFWHDIMNRDPEGDTSKTTELAGHSPNREEKRGRLAGAHEDFEKGHP